MMIEMRYASFVIFSFVLFVLIAQGFAGSEASQKQVEKAEPKPIVIKSKSLEVNNETKVVTFTGDVNAEKDEFVIDCQKMLVFYESAPKQKGSEPSETRIDKIIAEGQVVINRTQGGMATTEKAIYYQKDEKVVLTGNPVVKQGKDFVEGDRITIFLKENRTVVESSTNKKVKAIIFPAREER